MVMRYRCLSGKLLYLRAGAYFGPSSSTIRVTSMLEAEDAQDHNLVFPKPREPFLLTAAIAPVSIGTWCHFR